MTTLLLSLLVSAGAFYDYAQGTCTYSPGLTMAGDLNLSGNDLVSVNDIYSTAVATDAAPRVTVIGTQPVYASPGATNTTGASLVLQPSPGARNLTGVTRAATTGDTVAFAVQSNGTVTTTTKTEGAASPNGWVCAAAADDATCVCNLYALLAGAGAISGVTVSRTDATCSDEKLMFSITPGTSSGLTVTPSDGVNEVMVNGTDGTIQPTARISNPNGPTNIGGVAATTHAMATGSAIFGCDAGLRSLEADCTAFFDYNVNIASGYALSIGSGSLTSPAAGALASGTAKGALTQISTSVQSATFADGGGAASAVTAGLCPAGVTVLGVTGRVSTTATGCAKADIGDGVDADMWANDGLVAAGTTVAKAGWTAFTRLGFQSTSSEATVTGMAADGTTPANCVSGVWRFTCHYLDVVPDTTN